MGKLDIGNCVHCGKPFTDKSETIWVLRGNPYHPPCIRKNKDLLELWRATDWRQKDIL